MVATADRIIATLSEGGLLYRYPPDGQHDGVEGRDNTFTVCGFWLVEYLARAGRVSEARDWFERLLDLRNDVGLLSEEVDVDGNIATGNFPLAFAHVELITAALAVDRAVTEAKRDDRR